MFAFEKSSGEFFAKDMPLMDLKDLTLVDFDPYGSPGHDVQAFFANYKVRHPLRVNVTDGYALRLGLLKSDRTGAEREVYNRYLTNQYGDGTRENQSGFSTTSCGKWPDDTTLTCEESTPPTATRKQSTLATW